MSQLVRTYGCPEEFVVLFLVRPLGDLRTDEVDDKMQAGVCNNPKGEPSIWVVESEPDEQSPADGRHSQAVLSDVDR